MSSDDICRLSAAQAGRLIATKALSPVDLMDALLARIAARNPRTNSYILIDEEGARRRAKQAEDEIAQGHTRGPLHGLPYGAKDNYFSKGLRTCANSRVLMDHAPTFDAAMIERLSQSGAILVGKLNTWEYGTGHGLVYHDCAFPEARNPWKANHFTGGSSTGAGSSVADRISFFALGADTGGLIRSPAAGCGVVGLKPTYGRISRYGILPNSWSLDTAGALARTVEDCALALQATAGFDPRDPASSPLPVPDYLMNLDEGVRGLTIGVVRDLGAGVEPDRAVAAGLADVEAALRDQGARIVEARLPAPPSGYRELTALISGSERACAHEADFKAYADRMGRELREAIMTGLAARAVDYVAAQRRRRELALLTDEALMGFDAVLLPCAFHTAPSFDDADKVRRFMSDSATTAFNISGHPALAIPTGLDAAGLPTSAQLVGRYFDEATLLRVARAYERARAWTDQPPE